MSSLREWSAETRGTTFELVRHFLAHMFDCELLPAGGRGPGRYWQRIAVSAFALAIPLGLVVMDPPYLHGGGAFQIHSPALLRAVATIDQLALITLVSALTGLLGLLSWESLFPGRRDYLLLAGFPVRPRQIFLARFLSMLVFAVGLILAINILPAFLTPHEFTVQGDAEGSAVVPVVARLFSSCLSCGFVFFGIVALQGVLLNLLPGAWFTRVSTWCQGVLVAVFFLAGLYTWFILGWTRNDIANITDFSWAPPLWFAAAFRVIGGERDPFWMDMARRACLAAAVAPGLAAITYLISYRRYRKLLVEGSGHEVVSRVGRWNPLGLLARNPRQRAILHFIAITLSRSRTHRVVMLAYLGAGAGVMLNSVLLMGALKKGASDWASVMKFVALFWPLGFSMILVAGLRHAFSIPADLGANWLFQINEKNGRRDWARAVERFMIWGVLFPPYLVLFPLGVASLGWGLAARMAVLQIIVSLAIFDIHFYDWQQLPFTCSYIPGKKSLIGQVAGWIYVFAVLVPAMSIVIATVSQMTEIWAGFGVFILGIGIWLRVRRRDGWGEAKLQYEDLSDGVPDLGIRGIRRPAALSAGAK